MPETDTPTSMPDLIGDLLATPGLIWLILTIGAAGIVRGFTGFGTALIFVPIAGLFLPSAQVIAVMTMTGVASAAALLPRAWHKAQRGDVWIMAAAALVTVPLGLWLLAQMDQVAIRWIVTLIASGMLVALVTGWRFHGQVGTIGLIAIGAAAGVFGGMTGLTGPAVILFYLSGLNRVEVVRANTILFLAALDAVIVVNLMWQGMMSWTLFALAGVLAVPYFVTSLIGQALFDPAYERIYRMAAYAVIALAVITGLPLWD